MKRIYIYIVLWCWSHMYACFNLYSQRVIYHSLENCTSYIMAIENDYVDIDYKSNARSLEKGEVDIL